MWFISNVTLNSPIKSSDYEPDSDQVHASPVFPALSVLHFFLSKNSKILKESTIFLSVYIHGLSHVVLANLTEATLMLFMSQTHVR